MLKMTVSTVGMFDRGAELAGGGTISDPTPAGLEAREAPERGSPPDGQRVSD